MAEGETFAGDERGVSEVVGYALLIGMVSLGALLVVVYGSGAIQQIQEQTDERTVEISLQEIDSRLASLSNQAAVTRVEFEMVDLSPGRVDIVRSGYVNMTVNRNASCSIGAAYAGSRGAPLTSIRYEMDDGTVVGYEAGGVFQQDPSGRSSLVTAPDAGVENGIIRLQLVNLTGEITEDLNEAVLNTSASARRTAAISRHLFRGECVRPDNVTLSVRSDFYRAWGDYLAEQTDQPVQVHDSNQTVELYFSQDDLPASTDDDRNRVVNFSSNAPYMDAVTVTPDNITISKNASNSYRVSIRPVSNGSLDIGNTTTFKTANLGQRDGVDVVYVLDTSGSMADPINATATKLEAAKAAAIQSLSALNGTDRAGLVEYNSRANPVLSGGRRFTTALRGGSGTVEDSIAGLSAGGGTCINCGIRAALDMYAAGSNQTRNKTMIVLTDGQNERPWSGESETRAMARRAAARNITIYTAGFGQTESAVNEGLLRDVAAITGGEYNFSDNPDELSAFFRNSATNIVEEERVARVPLTVSATRNGNVQAPFIAGNDNDVTRVRPGFPNVNDPTAPSQFQQTFLVSDGDTVELNASWTRCSEYESVPLTSGGVQVARCANASSGTLHYPDDISVYRAGDDVTPMLTGVSAPWGETMRAKLESQNLLGPGDRLQLESNQLLVVFDFQIEGGNPDDWNRMPVLYEVGLSEGEAQPPVGYLQIREVRISDAA